GGIIAVLLGGSVLYDQPGQLDRDVQVAVPILIVAAVSGALFGLLITAFAIRTRRLRAPAGNQPASVAPGRVGKAHRPRTPRGSIRAVGEGWSARSADDQPID